jgi:hypothetical protein
MQHITGEENATAGKSCVVVAAAVAELRLPIPEQR